MVLYGPWLLKPLKISEIPNFLESKISANKETVRWMVTTGKYFPRKWCLRAIFSEFFKNLYKSCESLVIFGYLKPNDLRKDTEKSDETIFLKIYNGIYGLTGKSLVVKKRWLIFSAVGEFLGGVSGRLE